MNRRIGPLASPMARADRHGLLPTGARTLQRRARGVEAQQANVDLQDIMQHKTRDGGGDMRR